MSFIDDIGDAVSDFVKGSMNFAGLGLKEAASAAIDGIIPEIEMPELPKPPAPPGIDPAAKAARDAAAEEERKRAGRGRASTYGTPGVARGDLSAPNVASKTLLGQ